MLTKMTAKEARNNFSDLLGAVYYGNKIVKIDKKGRTFAVVINPDEYEALKQATKERFFEIVDGIRAANKDADPDQVLKEVTKAVEEVRQRRYEEKRQV